MRDPSRPSYGRLDLSRTPGISGGTVPLYLDEHTHTSNGGVATEGT